MSEPTDSAFFRIERDESVARVCVVPERITDEDNVEQFGQGLIDLIETRGVRNLLVNVRGLRYVTSSVLGKLIFVHRRLDRDDGTMVLTGIGPELMDIMEATRLTTLFHIAETPADAESMLEAA